MWSIDHLIQLGGNSAIVEIDKSKFMHWKYYHGCWTEGHWVLGLIEHDTLNIILVPIEVCTDTAINNSMACPA